ncbi:MAG: 4-(cytidine 5'-diphospho)-2-C-methyl-D-erythritol kinase [Bacteroidota bacterium]
MIAFPGAKINLGLRVLEKGEDGFHSLETVFYPVPIWDILEIIPAMDEMFSFASTGLPISGESESNLCVKAYRQIASSFSIPGVKIHLHKVIPMGAGLGGGSSDGATTILLLNNIFKLGMSPDEMEDHARQLGSDCAFFIRNNPVLATGRGDRFTPVSVDLSGYEIRIHHPSVHVNTAMAYRELDLLREVGKNALKKVGMDGGPNEFQLNNPSLADLVCQPVDKWKNNLMNDFETAIFPGYPEIEKIKDNFYNEGAVFAAMTGSGSSVYGIFRR